jgi:protein O-mannosyl-transferase
MVLWLALVLAATFIVYLPSLGNGFTNWDDGLYVTHNPLLRHPTVAAILTTPVAGNWHPLTIWSYVLNFRTSRLDPSPYHWLNLLLHLANTALVFAFVNGLAPGRRWTRVMTSLLFGIHPMHVESVAWIAERKDVLYAFFYLIGLLAYLRYIGSLRPGWLVATFMAFALSAASKPAAIVFPLTLVAIDFYRRRPMDGGAILEKGPFLFVSSVVLMLTYRAQIGAEAINREDIGPVFPRILVACFGVMMYVVKLFVPVPLSAVYPYPPNPATSLGPEFYLALVFVGVAIPATIYLCRGNRAVLFGIAFFFINVFLVLQFVSVGHVVMADRYTYLPYVGLLFALTWWLDEHPGPGSVGRPVKTLLAWVLLLLIPVSLIQTWTRCQVWRDSDSLWTDVIRQYPGRSLDAYINRGEYYLGTGRYGEALGDADQALAINAKSPRAYLNKGIALARMDLSDSALTCFDRALELNPGLAEARSARGGIRLQKGDLLGAMTDLNEGIRLNPTLRAAYVNRGIAYNTVGDLERAVADYRRAIDLEPGNPNAYQLWGAIGDALEISKRSREAVAAYDKAIHLVPSASADSLRGALYLGRSRAWLALGERDKAAHDVAEAGRLGIAMDMSTGGRSTADH